MRRNISVRGYRLGRPHMYNFHTTNWRGKVQEEVRTNKISLKGQENKEAFKFKKHKP